MKNVSLIVTAAALVSAGSLFAEEDIIRIQVQPGATPLGGGVLVPKPGAPQAQNPFGFNGKSAAAGYIEYLEKTVSLTPQQKEAITKIIETRDKAAQEFQAKNGDKLQAAMKAMTDAYQSKDKEAIAKAQKEYQELNAESTKRYQQAQTDLENVFTPEQKAKRQEAATAQMIKSMTGPAVLTEEQTTHIKDILAKRTPGREREEHQWYQSIQDVLTPEQKAVVAKSRALANAKASFARANLTADQWKKVETASEELAKTPNLNTETAIKQLSERINELLTSEQKEAMKKPLAGGGLQVGNPQAGSPQLQPINNNKPPGSPQIVRIGEGGEGVSITINGDGQVSTKVQPGGARTFTLTEGGRSEKGTWLGITTEPVSDALRAQLSLAKGEGLLVGQVVSRSPAAAAGLMQNDVLVRLDDQIIVELSQLRTLIAMKKAGDHVKLVYLRKAARQEATATLAEHEIESSERAPTQWLQAIPGLSSTKAEAGEHELTAALQQLKQLLGSALGAAAQKSNPYTAPAPGAPLNIAPQNPAPGASLNPNPWKRESGEGNLENLRKQLESSRIPAEAKEKVRKSIDQAKEAAEKARAAFEEATKAPSNAPQGGGFKAGDALNPAPKQP